MTDKNSPRNLIEQLSKRIKQGQRSVLATVISTKGEPPCQVSQKILLGTKGEIIAGTLGCSEFDTQASQLAISILGKNKVQLISLQHDLGEIEVYFEPYKPMEHLVVLSATPIAYWLLKWAKDLGFTTALIESNYQLITPSFREDVDVIVNDANELGAWENIRVVHTNHNSSDLATQIATLVKNGANFVGIVGSKRHSALYLEELKEVGLAPQTISKIQTPIGLDIGANTPQEIALSILSAVVAIKNNRPGNLMSI